LYYLEDTAYLPDPSPTSIYNTAVADSVATRTGDKIKIIMVDMENGAGIDYSDSLPDPAAIPPYDGGDMWGYRYQHTTYDKFHPNDKGNTKMALKLYEELVKELDEPDSLKNGKVMDIEFTAINDNSIKLTWVGNFIDEEGYIIERAVPGGAFSIIDTTGANTRCLIDTDVSSTNEYLYRVKAYNASGESLNSDEYKYTPTYYTLSITIVGEGTVEPNGGEYMAGYDSVITLRATPATGWKFDRYTGDIFRSVPEVELTMDSDKSITATFSELPSNMQKQTESLYRIYPNPVQDIITIELPDEFKQRTVIQLYDNTGRLLIHKKVQGSKYILDMDLLSPGTYLIKLSNLNNKTILKSLVKQ
jgi:hypothetical protein